MHTPERPKRSETSSGVFDTPRGAVGLLGTAAVARTTLKLSDIAVYPIGPPTRQAEERLSAGASMEDVLVLLRLGGCNVIDSITIASAVAGVSRHTAKLLVHRSAAWSDLSRAHDQFHETVERVVDDAQS